MALNEERKKIIRKVSSFQEIAWQISDAIWNFSELSLEEYRSSELLATTLETAGFDIEYGVAQLPTAFVATWKNGSGNPAIGFTAEYDALPALSQKSGLPFKKAAVAGAPGHGCGHNTMAAMQLLSITAIKEAITEKNLDVTLKYFGCPAEELGVSRPYMIRAGLFKGVDVVLDCHADSLFKTTYGMLGTALHSTMFTFSGKAAHAGWKPWMGRSAGDAVELLHAGTERMREHVTPTNRIHWITSYAGDAPNIVTDKAETWYYIRDLDENIESVIKWVNDCAKAAALMTQTRCKTKVLAAVHQRFYNQTLAELFFKNMKLVGKPRYTEKEKAFALELQEKAGFPKKGMQYPISLVNAEDDELRASSSDMGDVCLSVPTGQISIPVWVPGTPAHNWTATTTGATSIAHKGISAAAKAVALTVFELLSDKSHLKKIKAEFEILSRQRPYRPFLPGGTRPPLGFYRETMNRFREKLETGGNKVLKG